MRKFLIFLLVIGSSAWAALMDGPPREVGLVEKKIDQLANRDFDELGTKALAIALAKWKHAETENFIIHYRRATEARRAVREIEYDLWFVAQTLGVTKDRYSKKSHVFIFQDEREWGEFLAETKVPDWSASFAHGDELFLHVGGMGEGFDSHLLGHETTHAVVARLYPRDHWPVWLNEGFAEYMGGASVAAKKGQFIKGLQADLQYASLSLDELTAMTEYPADIKQVHQLYQSSEKLVRFLMGQFPKDRIARFIETVLAGESLEKAVLKVYGDQVADFEAFKKKYARFQK